MRGVHTQKNHYVGDIYKWLKYDILETQMSQDLPSVK